jgi:hypothetical protein
VLSVPSPRHPLALALALVATPLVLSAQQPTPDHARHVMPAAGASALPALPGQDASGAIGEIVRLLDADPSTDWSTVDLERLRQHLIDMNALTLGAAVRQRPSDGGLRMEVTGTGRATEAIRRMTASHGAQLASAGIAATSEPIPGGARFTVRAQNAADAALVARLRGLGFIGIMTLGAHHAPHHLAMARGVPVTGHGAGH